MTRDESRRSRLTIFFDLCEQNIPGRVADAALWSTTHDLFREEVGNRLTDVLYRAVMSEIAGFDPDHDGSTEGWAAMFLKSLVKKVIADVHAERSALADVSVHEHDHLQPVEIRRDTSWLDAQIAQLNSSTKRTRGHTKRIREADAIRRAFDIPELIRPASDERAALYTQLHEDPVAFTNSLESLAGGVRGDSPIDRIWEMFDEDDAISLLERDGRLLEMILESALAPAPRPGRDKLRAHRILMKRASSRRGWPTLAGKIQDTWVDMTFQDQADSDTTARKPQKQSELSWDEAVRQAIAVPGSPLGRTAAEIRTTIERLMEEL